MGHMPLLKFYWIIIRKDYSYECLSKFGVFQWLCVIASIAVPIGQVYVELPLIYINGLLYYGPCNSLN